MQHFKNESAGLAATRSDEAAARKMPKEAHVEKYALLETTAAAESGGMNAVGGRRLLDLFTCNFPAALAGRPAHVQLIDSPIPLPSLRPQPSPCCLLRPVAMLTPLLVFLILSFFWTGIPTLLAVQISLWLSLIFAAPAVSASLPPPPAQPPLPPLLFSL